MQKRKLKPAESALNQIRNWNRGALETSCGKVIVGFGPGAAVEHAPAGQQDEVIKALADVTARLVDSQHNLRQPILKFLRSGPKLLHLICIPQSEKTHNNIEREAYLHEMQALVKESFKKCQRGCTPCGACGWRGGRVGR